MAPAYLVIGKVARYPGTFPIPYELPNDNGPPRTQAGVQGGPLYCKHAGAGTNPRLAFTYATRAYAGGYFRQAHAGDSVPARAR